MALLVVGKEKSLGDVATRVLSARPSRATRAAAIEALRAVNPGIEHERLEPGTVLIVPPLSGGHTTVEGARDGAVAVLVDQVQAALDNLNAAADAQAARAAATRERTAQTIANDDLRRAASRDPALKATLRELDRVVAEETAAAGDEVEQTRTTIRDLKALVDAVRQVHT